jgi:hypothetical protein
MAVITSSSPPMAPKRVRFSNILGDAAAPVKGVPSFGKTPSPLGHNSILTLPVLQPLQGVAPSQAHASSRPRCRNRMRLQLALRVACSTSRTWLGPPQAPPLRCTQAKNKVLPNLKHISQPSGTVTFSNSAARLQLSLPLLRRLRTKSTF